MGETFLFVAQSLPSNLFDLGPVGWLSFGPNSLCYDELCCVLSLAGPRLRGSLKIDYLLPSSKAVGVFCGWNEKAARNFSCHVNIQALVGIKSSCNLDCRY
ncbi:hypothetical protein VNO78_04256 [Psophocarpus tetragonolobus]|uniref:Uncharacterized protein n=1 Tax=Psophocarpus tetragonolobus TaxID=3891 RepID=A0AAN9T2A5_PSOTE